MCIRSLLHVVGLCVLRIECQMKDTKYLLGVVWVSNDKNESSWVSNDKNNSNSWVSNDKNETFHQMIRMKLFILFVFAH
jgi:hypothetical protein